MDLQAEKPERKKLSPIKIVLVSAAVLGVIAIIGAIVLCRQVDSWQKSDYYGVDVGHLMTQAFGLDSNDLKDVAQNSQIYQKGSLYFLKGVMADNNGDRDGAISLYLQALDQFKQYPGWNNSYAFDAMYRLADDYEKTDKYSDAELWYKNCIDCAVKETNKKHAIVATAYRSLGRFYSHWGRHSDSIKTFQICLAIDLAGAGPTGEAVGQDYWWIGDQQAAAKQYSNAIESFSKARTIGKQKWKETDLAYLALAQGECAIKVDNDTMVAECLNQAEQLFGFHDDETGFYRTRLLQMDRLRDAGKLAQADKIAKESIPSDAKIAKNQVLGGFDEDYASYYESRSNLPAAEALLRHRLAQDLVRHMDDTAWVKCRVTRQLASCLLIEGKTEQASALDQAMLTAFHKAKRIPSREFLKEAIEVFRASKQPQQLKLAEADMRIIDQKKSAPAAQ